LFELSAVYFRKARGATFHEAEQSAADFGGTKERAGGYGGTRESGGWFERDGFHGRPANEGGAPLFMLSLRRFNPQTREGAGEG